MEKAKLKKLLQEGKTFLEAIRQDNSNNLLSSEVGQDCIIYKSACFGVGDDIVYVSDVTLMDYVPMDRPINDDESIGNLLSCCYTHNEFMEIAEGNAQLAKYLWSAVDWQSPSTLLDEMEEDEISEAKGEICMETPLGLLRVAPLSSGCGYSIMLNSDEAEQKIVSVQVTETNVQITACGVLQESEQ